MAPLRKENCRHLPPHHGSLVQRELSAKWLTEGLSVRLPNVLSPPSRFARHLPFPKREVPYYSSLVQRELSAKWLTEGLSARFPELLIPSVSLCSTPPLSKRGGKIWGYTEVLGDRRPRRHSLKARQPSGKPERLNSHRVASSSQKIFAPQIFFGSLVFAKGADSAQGAYKKVPTKPKRKPAVPRDE